MNPIAHLVGRAPVVPAVNPQSQTVDIAGVTVQLNPHQFATFLVLRPLTPVKAVELSDLLHLRRSRWSDARARQRIRVLRQSLKAATGRDLIETTMFGYRLVAP